jgi:hypothetical protein
MFLRLALCGLLPFFALLLPTAAYPIFAYARANIKTKSYRQYWCRFITVGRSTPTGQRKSGEIYEIAEL